MKKTTIISTQNLQITKTFCVDQIVDLGIATRLTLGAGEDITEQPGNRPFGSGIAHFKSKNKY